MRFDRLFQDAVERARTRSADSAAMLPSVLATAKADALAVAGASLSLTSRGLRVPLGASDADAAEAERLQVTLGVGPCLEAISAGVMVDAPATMLEQRWPVLYEQWRSHTPYRSALSVPVPLGHGVGCALNIYFYDEHGGPTLQPTRISIVALGVSQALSAEADAADIAGPGWLETPSSQQRLQIWTAIGVITERTGTTPHDALDLLRGWAFMRDCTLDIAAVEVVGNPDLIDSFV